MGRKEDPELVRKVASRAARRLDLLEWAFFGVAAALAALGGALVALLLAPLLGASFRTVWVVASLLMFAVPGLLALKKMKRDERQERAELLNDDEIHV